jgi:SAM-dependent methyltransferase
MNIKHFEDSFIDELRRVDPNNNYFTPIWDSVIRNGIYPKKVLDIGCGNGVFCWYAKNKLGFDLYGVDGSPYALSLATNGMFNQLKHINDLSINKIPYEDNSFDFCLSKDLLEHLVRPAMVMQEAYRMICKGGYFLVHVPNHFPLYGRLKFLFKNDIDTFGYFPGTVRWEFPHIRFFTKESLLDLAQKSGFEIHMDLSYHFPAFPGMARVPFGLKIGRRLAHKFPTQFSEAFTLLLKKPLSC